MNNILNILEPISIVLIASIEFKLLGPLFSITWRFFYDKELSNIPIGEIDGHTSCVKTV